MNVNKTLSSLAGGGLGERGERERERQVSDEAS